MRRIIREKEVREICGGISRPTLWHWRKIGDFPKPIQLSGNCIGWPENVIEEWLASRPLAGAEPQQMPAA